MNAGRQRSWSLLVLAAGLSVLVGSNGARADFERPDLSDYSPVETTEPVLVETSSVPVLMSTLFGVPPIWTYQQQVAPPPPPTPVVPTPPVIPVVPVPEPGTPPIVDPNPPDFPDGEIVGIKTPEPGTLLTGILGAGAVWYFRRRANRTEQTDVTDESAS